MLRNKEVRQFVILFCLIAAILIPIGFTIDLAAGVLVISAVILFGSMFFAFTQARYKSIAQLSEQIDLVLHDAEHLDIEGAEEGELSILKSEIIKMTLRIREQNDALKQEKEHLADSLADVAHQLRTPLTSVNLILSLLEKNSDENEQKALLREAEELLVKMDWLLTSLLKLSRLDAGIVVFESEEIEINRVIKDALHPLLIPMELRNITLQMDVPKGIKIWGDANWLSQGIQNILKNCMESAGDNGKIAIACVENPLFIEITIHDSGAGFETEDLHGLFDRFYRGKNSNTAGYGIGLALCKTIIKRQGGTILAKNHPKGGALFVIRFPK